jgi:hypothetical protein
VVRALEGCAVTSGRALTWRVSGLGSESQTAHKRILELESGLARGEHGREGAAEERECTGWCLFFPDANPPNFRGLLHVIQLG